MDIGEIKKDIKYKARKILVKTKFIVSSKKEIIPKKSKENFSNKVFRIPSIPSTNVLLIVVDCMRFKNTSMAGYERDTTPFLKSFGKSYKAVAGAPWTYPSVPTILTGLYPHNHGAYLKEKFKNFKSPLDLRPVNKSIPLLIDVLEYMNYKTYIATAIDPVVYSIYGRSNIIRYHYLTPAEDIFSDFMKWIKQGNSPFFAYLHLSDTHAPLNPPRRFRNYFGKVKDLPNIDTWNYQYHEERRKNPEKFEKYRYNKILLYDNTIRYVDWAIEKLVDELEKLKILDDTLIVITADHGEEFWEHAEIEAKYFKHAKGWSGVTHGHNVFREIVEVPLVLGGAFERENLRENRLQSLADLMPTILDILEVEYPKRYFDGVSLKHSRKKSVLSEGISSGYEKKALYIGQFKFLYAPWDGVKWVFNLKKDPEEQHPIKDPQIIQIFEQKLKKILSKPLVITEEGNK